MANLAGAGTQAAGLGARGARYTLLAVWVLGIWSTFLQSTLSQHLPQLITVFALQLASILILTLPGDRKLSRPYGLLCALTALFSGLVALFTISPGEESWPFNFATYLLALMTIRGNAGQGIAGGTALIAFGLVHGLRSGFEASDLFAFLILPFLALVMGIVWRFVLTIAVQREEMHLGEAELSRLASEASEAAAANMQALIDDVRVESENALQAIVHGQHIGDAQALEFAVLEEGIRDRIRSPQLRHPLLDKFVQAARERGVRVLLLGSESSAETPMEDLLANAVAAIIAEASEGSVTIRAIPKAKDAAISVLVRTSENTRRYSFSRAGELIGQH